MNDIADKLITKYNLAAHSYYTVSPYQTVTQEKREVDFNKTRGLSEKYRKYVKVGWYGIDLGCPTPDIWFDVIDEFFSELINAGFEFKILQVKIKFGQIRIYLEYTDKTILGYVNKLESVMLDKLLIY